MKIQILLLTILLVSSHAFGIGKSKTDPKDAQIATLTHQLDSVSKELTKYSGAYNTFYTTLKEKVFHYNYDPSKLAALIDSVKSADSLLIKKSTACNDSISLLKKDNQKLKAIIDASNSEQAKNVALMTQEEIDRAKILNYLNQLRELVDKKTITEAEFIAAKKKYLDKL